MNAAGRDPVDEEGFPSSSAQLPHEEEEEEEEGSFAAEFYRCGSDWSCLLPPEKKRKQANLLEIWGLNSNINNDKNPNPSNKAKKPKQANLWQMWGLNNPSSNKVSNNNKTTNPPPPTTTTPRACPFYKKIPGTPFTVDAFRYGAVQGCTAYFLTHFHYDHYGGLTKAWSHGPIYCTPLTARLLTLCLSLNSSFIHPLELETEYVIDGVRVTLLDANHCPGAALIHFRLPNGQCYLHTGDFRASKLMQSYPLLLHHRVNVLYLDTTYCNPNYRFPSKEDVLSYIVRVTKISLKKQPKTLIVVGAYSIGKECVYLAISKALGVKIYANAARRRVLHSFNWPDLSSNLSTEAKDTSLHVLPISSLRFEILTDYLNNYRNQYAAILAFRPTGWTYSNKVGTELDLIKPNSRGSITIYGVPYSEHSSFTELREFVKFLKPDKIIPTVNVWNPTNRDKMESYFREWLKGERH